jgi:hypothetical protein
MRAGRRDTCQEVAVYEQALAAAAGVMVTPGTGGGPGGECRSPVIRPAHFQVNSCRNMLHPPATRRRSSVSTATSAPLGWPRHIAAMRECSQILGLHEDLCHQHWVDSFPRRVCGGFESVGEHFAWIGRQVGTRLGAEACAAAAARYACFTRAGLQPFPGVEDASRPERSRAATRPADELRPGCPRDLPQHRARRLLRGGSVQLHGPRPQT